jgi:hypothetical protein
MSRNFSLKDVRVNDPRVAMRAVIGVLLLANLIVAAIALKPFGGSADDLRREQQSLGAQLTAARIRLTASRQLVDRVQTARSQGDEFLGHYFMKEDMASAQVLTELTELAQQSGIKMGQSSWSRDEIEGSDTLQMLSWQVGFEGTYANFTKFVNLLDKSPSFFIIETLSANAPQQQGGQSLNVMLKIDSFIRYAAGAPAL